MHLVGALVPTECLCAEVFFNHTMSAMTESNNKNRVILESVISYLKGVTHGV